MFATLLTRVPMIFIDKGAFCFAIDWYFVQELFVLWFVC